MLHARAAYFPCHTCQSVSQSMSTGFMANTSEGFYEMLYARAAYLPCHNRQTVSSRSLSHLNMHLQLHMMLANNRSPALRSAGRRSQCGMTSQSSVMEEAVVSSHVSIPSNCCKVPGYKAPSASRISQSCGCRWPLSFWMHFGSQVQRL